jgi:hypothetical protein
MMQLFKHVPFTKDLPVPINDLLVHMKQPYPNNEENLNRLKDLQLRALFYLHYIWEQRGRIFEGDDNSINMFQSIVTMWLFFHNFIEDSVLSANIDNSQIDIYLENNRKYPGSDKIIYPNVIFVHGRTQTNIPLTHTVDTTQYRLQGLIYFNSYCDDGLPIVSGAENANHFIAIVREPNGTFIGYDDQNMFNLGMNINANTMIPNFVAEFRGPIGHYIQKDSKPLIGQPGSRTPCGVISLLYVKQ